MNYFKPNEINKQHIIDAVENIEKNKLKLIPSTRWQVLINGGKFPPKEIMRYAHEQMNGNLIWEFGGGEPTNKYLKKLGFEIIDMQEKGLIQLIKKYKVLIQETQLKNEIYKWQLIKEFRGKPNLEKEDLLSEIKSIKFSNLIYAMALAVVYHLVKDKKEEMRLLFKNLFNESLSLSDRVNHFNTETLKIYRELGETLQHHQDERTIATYLTYKNPEKYTFYKHSFYKKFCNILGIDEASKNNKYEHYLQLLNSFINDYIEKDEELINMVKNYIPDYYDGSNNLLLAQDILYQTLDKEVEEINLGNFNVFKVSMGEFSEENFNKYYEERKILVHEDTASKGRSYISQAESFRTEIKEGDFFYLTYGNGNGAIKIIGRVTSPYVRHEDGWLERNYEVIYFNKNNIKYTKTNKWWTPNNNSTFIRIKNDELEDANRLIFEPYFNVKFKKNIKSNNEESFKFNNNNYKSMHPLNQLLYGPPGTGKTYNTINRALQIIENKSLEGLESEKRDALKQRFDQYSKDGQIMFTTFHQSMSYEDFIEGIKPEIEEDAEGGKSVIYEVKKGIFTKIVEEAKKIRYQSEDFSQQYTFDDAWDDLVSEANEYLEKEESLILNIQTVGMGLKVVDISEKGNLKVQPKSSKEAKIYTVSFSRAKKLQEAFPDLSVIKNIDKEFRAVIGGSNSTAYWAVLNYINLKINSESIITQQEIPLAPKPYVLIIDEINRGNVSQIFGELITLIEEDKRLGKDEALEVILPYSKEKFGVPSNLHIIGTMNTADRSVEALDTALRRRFSFVEMMPEYEELNKIQFYDFHLGELLKTINSRIEALLDRDHTIGHSYFINIEPNDTEALKEAFANKIIPLLQEYFYHDYEKIALILGEGFVECIEPKESKVEFARWNGKTLEKPETSRLFKIKKFDDNFNILDSIKHLLNRIAF